MLHQAAIFLVTSGWIVTFFARHCRFEMLLEILRWNLIDIPRKVDDEGRCIVETCSCGETVLLDSSPGF